MPKQITGSNQTAVDLQLTIGVDGDNVDAMRHEENWQALLNNDATLETRVASFRLTTGAGITGADTPTAIGNITISIPNAGITTAMLQDALVTVAKLAANSVGQSQLINNSVVTVKIADANVTAPKLAVNSVPTDKIVDGNVTTVKIADGNVTTPKIADANVTEPKLAAASVNVLKLHSTNTATAGQQLIVGTNNRITYEDKPVNRARGALIATGSPTSIGNVTTWTLESGLPSSISVGIGDPLISQAIPIYFPLLPPDDRTIGLWIVLEQPAGTEIDAVFQPWGSMNQNVGTGVGIYGVRTSFTHNYLLGTTGTNQANTQVGMIIIEKVPSQYKVAIGRGASGGMANLPTTAVVKMYFAQN